MRSLPVGEPQQGAAGAELAPSIQATPQASVAQLQPLQARTRQHQHQQLRLLVTAAIALLRESAHLDVIAAVASITLQQASQIVGQLEREGVLTGASPARLSLPQEGVAALEQLPSSVCALMHAGCAEQLRARGASDLEVCRHLLRAPGQGLPANVAALRRCAHAHMRRAKPREAAVCLQRALREPPQESQLPEILTELAEALAGAQMHRAAIDTAQRALERSQTLQDQAGAVVALFKALCACGQAQQALSLLSGEIERLQGVDEELSLRLEIELLRQAPLHRCILEAALQRHRARELDETLPSSPAYLLAVGQMLGMGPAARAADAIATVRRSLRLGGLEPRHLESAVRSALLMLRADDPETARALIALARSPMPGTAAAPALDAVEGLIELRWGSVAVASQRLQAALELACERGEEYPKWLALAFLAHALHERGERERLAALIAQHPPERHEQNMVAAVMRVAKGKHLLGLSEHRLALEELLAVDRRKEAIGLTNPAGYHHIEPAVDALIALGRLREALELANRNLQRAQAWGAPITIALAKGALASCLPPREGIALITEAIGSLPADANITRADLLLREGRIMIAAGQPREARIVLRESLDTATRIGALRIATACQAALHSLGARPRRPHTHGVDSLTVAEQRVAMLAASGLQNREIAERLHLSVRTVENHLRHVYSKLCTDRRGLANALGTSGSNGGVLSVVPVSPGGAG